MPKLTYQRATQPHTRARLKATQWHTFCTRHFEAEQTASQAELTASQAELTASQPAYMTASQTY